MSARTRSRSGSRLRARAVARPVARGATLIELVAIIVVLSITVPVTVAMLQDQGASSADAVQLARASTLSTAVCEQIIADAAATSGPVSFASFADASAYLDAPGTGLRARLDSVAAMYEAQGFSYTVEIGELVDDRLVVSETTGENIFREITVRVRVPLVSTESVEIPTSFVITELGA